MRHLFLLALSLSFALPAAAQDYKYSLEPTVLLAAELAQDMDTGESEELFGSKKRKRLKQTLAWICDDYKRDAQNSHCAAWHGDDCVEGTQTIITSPYDPTQEPDILVQDIECDSSDLIDQAQFDLLQAQSVCNDATWTPSDARCEGGEYFPS